METDVAQASELMIESTAFSLCEVLEPWTNVLDKEHRLHGVREINTDSGTGDSRNTTDATTSKIFD